MKAFHQSAHIRALADLIDGEVVWVVEEELSSDRQSQGWPVPNDGNVQVIIKPENPCINQLVHTSPHNTVHIFSGIGAFPLVKKAFLQASNADTLMGLLVENHPRRGIIGFLRFVLHRMNYLRYGKHIDFILAMGYIGDNGGGNWFRRCGYSDNIIFPYGYFLDAPETYDPIATQNFNKFNLVFIGRYLHLKGVDILFEALASITNKTWTLKMIGDGPLRNKWKRLSVKHAIEKKIQFIPVMANQDAMKIVEASDLLILPSRFDGWGVVINEALLRGVPVICSDRCGGQDLLQESWRGETFISESAEDLRRILQKRIDLGPPSSEDRIRIRNWAAENTSGHIAAKYLLDVISHVRGHGPRPVPPWLIKSD